MAKKNEKKAAAKVTAPKSEPSNLSGQSGGSGESATSSVEPLSRVEKAAPAAQGRPTCPLCGKDTQLARESADGRVKYWRCRRVRCENRKHEFTVEA